MGWKPYQPEDEKLSDTLGVEGGVVVADEVYKCASRITLEINVGNSAPAAITCGIYGWMMHTRYFSSLVGAHQAYEEMKAALADIVDRIPLETDPDVDARIPEITGAIEAFVEKHP